MLNPRYTPKKPLLPLLPLHFKVLLLLLNSRGGITNFGNYRISSKIVRMKILVIDVGGTHLKVYGPGSREPVKIDSGPTMTARRMVTEVKKAAVTWKYDEIGRAHV